MFEDKKWSEQLKQFAREIFGRRLSTKEGFAELIEMAIEEGRQEVQDDPRKYDLYSEEDTRSQEREPSHNEGYD